MIHRSLDGIVLQITTRYNNLYQYDVHVEEATIANSSKQYFLKGGFAVDLFLTLKEFLRFRYTLVPEVGPYNFSLAENRSIDIFLGSYSLSSERAKLVDATFVTGQSRIVAFINHDFEGSDQNLFALPFSRALWYGIILMLTIAFVIVGFIGWVEKVPSSETSFHFVSVILLKDFKTTFYKTSCRVAFLAISASIMMFMLSYTSNMVSMKAVIRFSLNSLDSVLESRYKVLLELGFQQSSIRVILEALAHIPIIAILLKRIIDAKFEYESFGKAILEVHQSPSVYIIDEETGISTIEEEIGHFPCSWSAIPVLNLKYPWAMYMRKHSPFRDSINYGLLRFDEIGLTKRIRNKWVPHIHECKGNLFPFESISIHQVYYAFLILAVGTAIAIVWIILVENRCYTKRWKMESCNWCN